MKELRGALALVGEYRMTPAARAARAHPGRVRQTGGGGMVATRWVHTARGQVGTRVQCRVSIFTG